MASRLWLRLVFFFLVVVLVAVTASLLFRNLVLEDFRRLQQGEMVDRIYWVTAALESSHERDGGWRRQTLEEEAVWAWRLGLEMRLLDHEGRLLMDSSQALESLSPLARKRLGRLPTAENIGGVPFEPYPLFLGGEEIGQLQVRSFAAGREELFVFRANRFLLWSSLALGGMALLIGILMARRLTAPVRSLAAAAEAIGQGDLAARVPVKGVDELATLSRSFNRMAETLELQESLRKTLYANAAHELRTPLAAMRGELEGMIDGLLPSSQQQLSSILEETRRLTTLVEGVESLVQAEATPLTLKRQALVLQDFLEALGARYGTLFEEKGVRLKTAVPPEVIVWADPDRLSQVVVNLLSNALRATDVGGEVVMSGRKVAGGTEMTVTDTGHGIGEQEIPFVFERFYRGSQGGHGIGLAIVREIVAGHGGTITVESRPGEGARFVMFFPDDEDA
jgi:two-component system sensor histidine kinase BaeS